MSQNIVKTQKDAYMSFLAMFVTLELIIRGTTLQQLGENIFLKIKRYG